MNAKKIALAATAILTLSMSNLAAISAAQAKYVGGQHKGFSVNPGGGYNGGVRWFYTTRGGRSGMEATARDARKAGRKAARAERRSGKGK